jgi:hypothetical protein
MAPEPYFPESDRGKRFPPSVFLGLACAVGMFVVALNKGFFSAINTKYSTRDLRSNFSRLSVGDRVEKVYVLLGPPLRVHVNPDIVGDGVYRQYKDTNVNLEHILDLLADTNTRVSLIYSEPKTVNLRLKYQFYYIVASSAVVERIGGPVSMD